MLEKMTFKDVLDELILKVYSERPFKCYIYDQELSIFYVKTPIYFFSVWKVVSFSEKTNQYSSIITDALDTWETSLYFSIQDDIDNGVYELGFLL